MKQLDTAAAAGAAFFPYGQDRPVRPTPARLHPGAAEVMAGDGRRGVEVYAIERDGGHWQLFSALFDEAWRLLARVPEARLPTEPVDAAAELIGDLWSLRHGGRLRFVRGLEVGSLGRLRWERIQQQVPPAPLEQALRDEGHEVRALPGPVGTTEHVLLLRRAALPAARRTPGAATVVDGGAACEDRSHGAHLQAAR